MSDNGGPPVSFSVTGDVGSVASGTLGSIVLHAPHTSRDVPADVRAELLISPSELDRELDALTDAGVDLVIDALGRTRPGVACFQARYSRLVFDPERFPDDPAEAHGMGIVYTRRADGTPLRDPLDAARTQWYRDLYDAYTATIEGYVADLVATTGVAYLIDLHSYPKEGLGYEDPTRVRPEVCIGTDFYHTPEWVADAAEAAFSHYETARDTPFAGSYLPGSLYRRERRAHTIMIETRRDMLATPWGVAGIAGALDALVEYLR